jgi:hypothetical protein
MTAKIYINLLTRIINVEVFYPYHQYCGTVIIYFGSGSYFVKVLVPVPFPVPVLFPDSG